MAEHDISPGFVKIRYGKTGQKHTATIPCKPVGIPTAGVDPNLTTYSGSVLFSTAMDAWANMIAAAFPPTHSFDSASFWYKPTDDDDPVWIWEHTFTGIIGTGAATDHPAAEGIMTFRTALGGLMKLYFLGIVLAVDSVQSPSAGLSNPYDDIFPFAVGTSSWIYGRDDAKLIGLITLKTKTNDVLRRKYLTG